MRKIIITLFFLFLIPSLFASYDYLAWDLFIDNGEYKIPATVTVPVGDEGEKFPAVVMLHGNGSDRHEAGNAYDYLAPEMAKEGIASIRFDYIGNGESEKDYVDFTYSKAISDALSSYRYLTFLKNIDEKRIGIMGWSQGGRLTFLTLAATDVFKSALTWAAAWGEKDLEDEYNTAKVNGYYEVTYDWREPLKQGVEYYEEAMSIDYNKEGEKITVPFFAIQGTLDTAVPPETAVSLTSSLTSSPLVILYRMQGAEHTFNVFTEDKSQLEELTALTTEWFKRTL